MLVIDLDVNVYTVMGNCDVIVLFLYNAMNCVEEPFIFACMVTKLKFHWLTQEANIHSTVYFFVQFGGCHVLHCKFLSW